MQNALRNGVGPYINIAIYLPLVLGLLSGFAKQQWPLVLALTVGHAVLVVALLLLDLRRGGLPWMVHAFAFLNVALISSVTVVTGGNESPFWLLFVIETVVGTIFSGYYGLLLNVLAATLTLGGMALAGNDLPSSLGLVSMQLLVLFFVGFLTEQATAIFLREWERKTTQTSLLHEMVEAQEAERRRLFTQVHDGALQSLGVALMNLDRARLRLQREEPELAEQELGLLRSTLTGAVEEVRTVLSDLSLEVLNEYGLGAALRDYLSKFSTAAGIEFSFTDSVGRRLPADTEMLIYRLAQEALANVRKHAEATRVEVSLSIVGDQLQLAVADNGRGFDVEEALRQYEAGKALGLRSLQQRVEAVGGSMELSSSPGDGTKLIFRCPLP